MKKDYIFSENTRLALIANIPEKCNYILIACHGFLGGKENRGFINLLAKEVERLGIGLVAFDFAGCGESEGDFSEITLTRQVNNLKSVIDFVRKTYNLPIILLGRSFGGSTILALNNKEDNIAANILWSTPVFLAETFSIIMPGVFQKMLQGENITLVENNQAIKLKADFALDINKHNMEQYLLNLKDKPLLVIHGTADNVVNVANAKYIEEKLPHATVYVVEGADHSFTNQEEYRINLTVKWLEKLFS